MTENGSPGTPPAHAAHALTAEGKYRLLLEIARRSRGTLDLGEILDRLLDGVRPVLDYDAAGIFILNRDLGPSVGEKEVGPAGLIAGVARRGFPIRPVDEDAMLSSGAGLVGHAIRSGLPVVVDDVRRDARYVAGRDGTLSEIVVPIVVDGRAIGALNLESDRPGAYTEDDAELLGFFAEATAIAVEKAMLHRHLLEREQLETQLRLAREVQLRLLPPTPPTLAGYDLAGVCLPSLQLGGDCFDYFRRAGSIPEDRLGLVIADVAGKGVPAALVMATFRALLRAQLEQASDLESTLGVVSRLLRDSAGPRAFVTCFYGELDPATGGLVYANCGHPPPLVVRAGGRLEELGSTGPALGVFAGARHEQREAFLAPGDTLLLYTDGLAESESPGGEQFGLGRIEEVMRGGTTGAGAGAAVELVDSLVRAVHEHSATSRLQDDLTLVVVRRLSWG